MYLIAGLLLLAGHAESKAAGEQTRATATHGEEVSLVSDVAFQVQPLDAQYKDLSVQTGIGGPAAIIDIQPINFTWTYAKKGESEELFGEDWAKLSLLENAPRISYGQPRITQVLPTSGSWRDSLAVSGQSNAGNLPVFVKIVFLPRRSTRTLEFTDTETPASLASRGRLIIDDLIVYDEEKAYEPSIDYIVNGDSGSILAKTPLLSKTVTVVFTEYFPAYQCSINEGVWSPAIMLDPERPYPDEETEFLPISIDHVGRRFPITDELGNELGLMLQVLNTPTEEYLLRIDSTGAEVYGAEATLEIEFDRPGQMNGIKISPFANYPVYLKAITAEGLTATIGDRLFEGNVLLDKPQTIRFPRRAVRRLFLTLYQENYTYKEHLVDPADKLKRDALASLQSVLPFAVRRIERATAQRLTGVQYEFGLREIKGQDWKSEVSQTKPGIKIIGPFTVEGTPEVLHFDLESFPKTLLGGPGDPAIERIAPPTGWPSAPVDFTTFPFPPTGVDINSTWDITADFRLTFTNPAASWVSIYDVPWSPKPAMPTLRASMANQPGVQPGAIEWIGSNRAGYYNVVYFNPDGTWKRFDDVKIVGATYPGEIAPNSAPSGVPTNKDMLRSALNDALSSCWYHLRNSTSL
jgi:hypothetical protein